MSHQSNTWFYRPLSYRWVTRFNQKKKHRNIGPLALGTCACARVQRRSALTGRPRRPDPSGIQSNRANHAYGRTHPNCPQLTAHWLRPRPRNFSRSRLLRQSPYIYRTTPPARHGQTTPHHRQLPHARNPNPTPLISWPCAGLVLVQPFPIAAQPWQPAPAGRTPRGAGRTRSTGTRPGCALSAYETAYRASPRAPPTSRRRRPPPPRPRPRPRRRPQRTRRRPRRRAPAAEASRCCCCTRRRGRGARRHRRWPRAARRSSRRGRRGGATSGRGCSSSSTTVAGTGKTTGARWPQRDRTPRPRPP
jgi:hypothetical protein